MVPEHHAIDHDDDGRSEEESNGVDAAWLEQFAALADRPTRRSDFLSGAGKLTVAGLGLGGLAGALAGGAAARTASLAASSRLKKIGLIEVTFSPFFTENFHNPLKAYLKKKQPGLGHHVRQREQHRPDRHQRCSTSTPPRTTACCILSTGDQMSAWQHAVQKATKQGSDLHQPLHAGRDGRHAEHALLAQAVGSRRRQRRRRLGARRTASPIRSSALLGNLSDAQGSKRTDWAWKTIKAKFPNAKLAGSGAGHRTPTAARRPRTCSRPTPTSTC